MTTMTKDRAIAVHLMHACDERNSRLKIRLAFLNLAIGGFTEDRLRGMACSPTWSGPIPRFIHYPTTEQIAEWRAAFPDGWDKPGIPPYSSLPPSMRAELSVRD